MGAGLKRARAAAKATRMKITHTRATACEIVARESLQKVGEITQAQSADKLAREITFALIRAGHVRDSAFTVVSRIIKERCELLRTGEVNDQRQK